MRQQRPEAAYFGMTRAERQRHFFYVHPTVVGVLAGELAHLLGYSHTDTCAITQAGRFHDIGKQTFEAVLEDRPLTCNEYAAIKRHTILGQRILLREKLSLASIIARQHHERADGSGYPDGQRNGSINVAAKIVSLVDSFDAMTDPLRPTTTHSDENARHLLETQQHRYDQNIMGVFLAHYDQMVGLKTLARDVISLSASPSLSPVTRARERGHLYAP